MKKTQNGSRGNGLSTAIADTNSNPGRTRICKSLVQLLAGGLLGAAIPAAHAANWAWNTAPGSGNLSATNWTSGTTPGAGTGAPVSTDSLFFGPSSQLTLSNDFSGFTGITNNFLLSTDGLLTDLNANADHYFYRVSPYIP